MVPKNKGLHIGQTNFGKTGVDERLSLIIVFAV